MLTLRARARGCLLGALVGDALGSQVEFLEAAAIRRRHPGGLRQIGPSPVWRTLAGQPTDDGELTLALARSISEVGGYDAAHALDAYRAWAVSQPFDMGTTTAAALRHDRPNPASQANGALMRQAPLAIWAVGQGDVLGLASVLEAAGRDTVLTHPHPVCIAASQAHLAGLLAALRGAEPDVAHACAWGMAAGRPGGESIGHALREAKWGHRRLTEGVTSGWVLVALQNAWYQALHEPSFEEGLVDTVMRGGDTDTNACIAGALLGALHGWRAIPVQWRAAVLGCQPQKGQPGVQRPRPPRYWPVDILDLADRLAGDGAAG